MRLLICTSDGAALVAAAPAASIMTLEPGDIVAMGTAAGALENPFVSAA